MLFSIKQAVAQKSCRTADAPADPITSEILQTAAVDWAAGLLEVNARGTFCTTSDHKPAAYAGRLKFLGVTPGLLDSMAKVCGAIQ
jgi:fructose-1,6-bisphosphatase/inositol monophosphatase family enzyme